MGSIIGEVMIDDHPKNVDYFSGERFIIDQSQNAKLTNSSYTRVKSWVDIYRYL
ncbi:MAG: 5' nucleotidase, NT5C type [Bacteroidales bacterium]